ncbi:hypothetical protein ACFWUU_14160 [Kribbella sp. NPDC058693]|uniref:hypothetical protein n=1 Tax=Kribbella sp. NPDC058693 TaxID=3346602 RepID=UPI00366500C3
MSQQYVEPGSYRNPSDDAWWRRALDATGATMQLRAFEQDGREVNWSDAVMNASAAAAMGLRGNNNERWANLPSGPLGNLSDGFAQRLAEEYIENGRMGYHIDNTEFLPNVRMHMARGDIDRTLETAATSIVTSADPGEHGERWHHPDPDLVSDVRNAMSRQLLDGRYADGQVAGSEAVADENFAYRLGYATADAGVKAVNAGIAARPDKELARTVEQALGAQAAPRVAAAGERTDGAGARAASGGAAAAASAVKETGAAPMTR